MAPARTIRPAHEPAGCPYAPPASAAVVATRLVAAFDRAVAQGGEPVLRAMECAARAIAMQMRDRGLAPEVALGALKALLTERGATGWHPSLAVDNAMRPCPEAPVYERLFGAWINAFYPP